MGLMKRARAQGLRIVPPPRPAAPKYPVVIAGGGYTPHLACLGRGCADCRGTGWATVGPGFFGRDIPQAAPVIPEPAPIIPGGQLTLAFGD